MRVPLGSIHYRHPHLGSTVADTIQRIEGYYPGSLSYRLNNPGNLTYAGQPGATPVTTCSKNVCHTWASWPTYEAGYQGLENQIALDAGRGETIDQFIHKYAPASDSNNPESYGAQLAAATHLSVDDPLSEALAFNGEAIDGNAYPDQYDTYDAEAPYESGFDLSPAVLFGGLAAAALFMIATR